MEANEHTKQKIKALLLFISTELPHRFIMVVNSEWQLNWSRRTLEEQMKHTIWLRDHHNERKPGQERKKYNDNLSISYENLIRFLLSVARWGRVFLVSVSFPIVFFPPQDAKHHGAIYIHDSTFPENVLFPWELPKFLKTHQNEDCGELIQLFVLTIMSKRAFRRRFASSSYSFVNSKNSRTKFKWLGICFMIYFRMCRFLRRAFFRFHHGFILFVVFCNLKWTA